MIRHALGTVAIAVFTLLWLAVAVEWLGGCGEDMSTPCLILPITDATPLLLQP